MWQKLEQNWKDFFGLTGEIPVSLNLIVQDVQVNINRTNFGRKEKLSLRNQVSIVVWVADQCGVERSCTKLQIT